MTETKLTPQQIQFFNTFGYLCFPGLMADCIDRVIEEFEAVWAARGGGHQGEPHDGQARSCIVPFADQSEYLSSLLDDPRIHDIAAGLLGDDFNYTCGDGNFYVGDTRWHSDGYDAERIPSIKIAFYLDPLTRDTGAVRLIPSSHLCGDVFADSLQQALPDSDRAWGIALDQMPCVVVETQPGDIVVFWHNTKHAAFGGSERRRMFTMNFYEHVPEDRLEVLVHPQSIVHSLVAYVDGSVLAQLGMPDMRTPIAYALGWPHRIAAPSPRLDLAKIGTLTFEAPDLERFPALGLARQALQNGGAAPTILNAANEIAVAGFLTEKIGFLDIADVTEETLQRTPDRSIATLDDVVAVDTEARRIAGDLVSASALSV